MLLGFRRQTRRLYDRKIRMNRPRVNARRCVLLLAQLRDFRHYRWLCAPVHLIDGGPGRNGVGRKPQVVEETIRGRRCSDDGLRCCVSAIMRTDVRNLLHAVRTRGHASRGRLHLSLFDETSTARRWRECDVHRPGRKECTEPGRLSVLRSRGSMYHLRGTTPRLPPFRVCGPAGSRRGDEVYRLLEYERSELGSPGISWPRAPSAFRNRSARHAGSCHAAAANSGRRSGHDGADWSSSPRGLGVRAASTQAYA